MAYPVAVVQSFVEPGCVEQNRAHAAHLTAEAAARGARLILLPAACISDVFRGAEKLAESIPGRSTDVLAQAAGDAIVALPLLEQSDGKVYGACALAGRSGIRGVARQTHLARDSGGHNSFSDSEVIAAGNELSIFDLDGVRVGILLGFDAEFPEAFRALALRGADIVLAALNCVLPDTNFLCGMAMRNRLPLLVSNRIGFRRVYPAMPEYSAAAMSLLQEKDGSFLQRCKGGSTIIDADGRLLAQPSQESRRDPAPDPAMIAGLPAAALIPSAHFQEEQVLSASLRIDEIRVQRLTSPFIAERREELYRVE